MLVAISIVFVISCGYECAARPYLNKRLIQRPYEHHQSLLEDLSRTLRILSLQLSVLSRRLQHDVLSPRTMVKIEPVPKYPYEDPVFMDESAFLDSLHSSPKYSSITSIHDGSDYYFDKQDIDRLLNPNPQEYVPPGFSSDEYLDKTDEPELPSNSKMCPWLLNILRKPGRFDEDVVSLPDGKEYKVGQVKEIVRACRDMENSRFVCPTKCNGSLLHYWPKIVRHAAKLIQLKCFVETSNGLLIPLDQFLFVYDSLNCKK